MARLEGVYGVVGLTGPKGLRVSVNAGMGWTLIKEVLECSDLWGSLLESPDKLNRWVVLECLDRRACRGRASGSLKGVLIEEVDTFEKYIFPQIQCVCVAYKSSFILNSYWKEERLQKIVDLEWTRHVLISTCSPTVTCFSCNLLCADLPLSSVCKL